MDLRKTLTLCLALLLVAGFAVQATAQEGDPSGWRVLLESPDSAGWAGIGDSVIVKVQRTTAIGDSALSVFVGLYEKADTLTADDLTATQTATAGVVRASATGTGVSSGGGFQSSNFVTSVGGVLSSPSSTASGTQTYRFAFGVDAGDSQSTNSSSLVAQAFIDHGTSGLSEWKQLTNISTLSQFNVSGSDLNVNVGDGKVFGIDGQRPLNTKIDTTYLTLPDVFKIVSGDTTFSAGIGDDVTANIEVSSLGSQISKANVYIVKEGTVGLDTDSVYATYSFDLTDLLSGSASKALSLSTVSKPAGQAITATQNRNFPNNQRVFAVAHLVDRAGNVSSDAASDASPSGFSDNTIVHVIDTTAPVITMSNPDSSDDYVTGRIDTMISIVNDGNPPSASTVKFSGNPVRFAVSEGTKERTISDGDSTLAVSSDSAITATSYFTKGAFDNGEITVTVAVKDSVGNSASKAVSGVDFDDVAPTITIFPSNDDLGQGSGPDTINAGTAQGPVVTYNEALDSASVRYIQVTSGSSHDLIDALASNKLSTPDEEVELTLQDTLIDGNIYSLQFVAIDKAGNANATETDTLLYDKEFENPVADSFAVVGLNSPAADSQVVGTAFDLEVVALDSQKTRIASARRKAVTFKNSGVMITVSVGEADADKLGDVKITGSGVDTTGLYGTGMAVLKADSWTLGRQTIKVHSESVLDSFTVAAADTANDIEGAATGLYFDSKQMAKYRVWATEGGESVTSVSGEFGITVVPTDEYGNASLKPSNSLDTRVTALKEIFAELSSNRAAVAVPQGPQSIVLEGSSFTGIASGSGTGLVINAITSSVTGDTSTIGDAQTSANGKSAAIAFAPEGEEPVGDDAPAAPDSLIVQDYLGADGQGDQGGFVLVSFPNSDNHSTVSTYRLHREVSVTTGLDSLGNLMTLDEPVDKWISWTKIDAVPVAEGGDAITQAVVPTLDNVASRWAITAERGGQASDVTVAGKRVFTKQNVQQMVKLLGLDPNRVYSHEELSELFTPSKDYVKSILGDQENVLFASLDPDLSALVGNTAVPTSIRTDGAEVASSLKTIAAHEARAIDNIPPAQISGGEANSSGGQVTLTWNASEDDKIVATAMYRGFAIPIPGVAHYVINRGTASSAEATQIATVPAGQTSYVIENPLSAGRVYYRIDAVDLDNVTNGPGFSLQNNPQVVFTNANGARVYIMTLVNAQTPYVVDFEDFLTFAAAFNGVQGEEKYNPQADTNLDGTVNFQDFLNFAASFNQAAVTQGGQPIPSTKPVIAPQTPGVNESVEAKLRLQNDRILPGQNISLDVDLTNVKSLQGYGITVSYDPTRFEFIDAVPAEEDLLKANGAETPIFLTHTEDGKVMLGNTIVDGNPVSDAGSAVTMTFKVLGEFEDDARFDIADAVVFDGKGNSNPVVVLGSLEVQTTPTEFALLQNYPNPFNPETTIKYNLSEGTNVNLRIYNIVGQVVKTLVAERQSAGRYQVRWDGTDDRGSAVSSGIYFYQIAAGKFRDVKRLMLLK